MLNRIIVLSLLSVICATNVWAGKHKQDEASGAKAESRSKARRVNEEDSQFIPITRLVALSNLYLQNGNPEKAAEFLGIAKALGYTPCHINGLPDDVMGLIFSFLPMSDKINANSVCTLWAAIAEEVIWKPIADWVRAPQADPLWNPITILGLEGEGLSNKQIALQCYTPIRRILVEYFYKLVNIHYQGSRYKDELIKGYPYHQVLSDYFYAKGISNGSILDVLTAIKTHRTDRGDISALIDNTISTGSRDKAWRKAITQRIKKFVIDEKPDAARRLINNIIGEGFNDSKLRGKAWRKAIDKKIFGIAEEKNGFSYDLEEAKHCNEFFMAYAREIKHNKLLADTEYRQVVLFLPLLSHEARDLTESLIKRGDIRAERKKIFLLERCSENLAIPPEVLHTLNESLVAKRDLSAMKRKAAGLFWGQYGYLKNEMEAVKLRIFLNYRLQHRGRRAERYYPEFDALKMADEVRIKLFPEGPYFTKDGQPYTGQDFDYLNYTLFSKDGELVNGRRDTFVAAYEKWL